MKTATSLSRLPKNWLVFGLVAVFISCLAGILIGPIYISPRGAIWELAGKLTGREFDSGLSEVNSTILTQLRLPRVVLASLVGAMLAVAGCAYQGTFRNSLADPYLLGVSAGAGLGATVAISQSNSGSSFLLPIAAFIGAITAVALTYSLGRSAVSGRSSGSLILAGVAVASLLTAAQTLVQQRNPDKVREVYSWTLGRLSTTGWSEVWVTGPYVLVCILVLIRYRRVLDIFSVGDEEALALGLPVAKARAVIVIAASLGTAAAVATTGLIGFIGIIVPHLLRIFVGNSYRILIPLSAFAGAGFLVIADIFARTAFAPEEIPIGVVTALFGAPFFLYVLGSSRGKDMQ